VVDARVGELLQALAVRVRVGRADDALGLGGDDDRRRLLCSAR
jgi:hypothetical protein